jgi:3-oxoacyl-[acyl-carrier-protein] synthase-1
MPESMRRVVVTGVGCVSSIGRNAAEVKAALREGRSGLRFNPDMKAAGFKCGVYAPVPDWDPAVVDKKARKTLSRSGEYAFASAFEAMTDAGLVPADVAGPNTAVVIGTAFAGLAEGVRAQRTLSSQGNPSRAGATGVVKSMASTAAANLAAHLGVRGRAYCLSSACSTGLDAIGHAYELLAFGQHELALCGASEEEVWRQVGVTYDNWGGMPKTFDDRPAEACRPYDLRREGIVMSEGGAVLVLETLDRARARGAQVHAEIAGYGCSNDGKDMFEPTGHGLKRALSQALGAARERGAGPIDYINTHGGASAVGDPVEIGVLREVFGGGGPPLSSTKGQTGHAMGATGALEAVYTLLMLRHGFMAPTANLREVDPRCAGVTHIPSVVDRPFRTALSFNVGLGGTNSAMVFAKLPD